MILCIVAELSILRVSLNIVVESNFERLSLLVEVSGVEVCEDILLSSVLLEYLLNVAE